MLPVWLVCRSVTASRPLTARTSVHQKSMSTTCAVNSSVLTSHHPPWSSSLTSMLPRRRSIAACLVVCRAWSPRHRLQPLSRWLRARPVKSTILTTILVHGSAAARLQLGRQRSVRQQQRLSFNDHEPVRFIVSPEKMSMLPVAFRPLKNRP